MSEYKRISVPYGNNIDIYQIVDKELCMILDKVTGENIRFAEHHNSIGTIKEALTLLTECPEQWRWIIVKLSCVVSHKIEK